MDKYCSALLFYNTNFSVWECIIIIGGGVGAWRGGSQRIPISEFNIIHSSTTGSTHNGVYVKLAFFVGIALAQ